MRQSFSSGHATVLLIHGGLWEDGMDADRFWAAPGISAGLERAGLTVLAPNRLRRPPDWDAEVEHLAPALPGHPVHVVAGSNGCSVAVRLASAFPDRIGRLLLAWPATAGDPAVDARARTRLTELGATEQSLRALLGGQTLRGVSDAEITALGLPVSVLPSKPENPPHQRGTVDALLRLLPDSRELPGCPEPPHPAFASHLPRFLSSVSDALGR
jgi:pimeloyl-ACP methyl ester carboxylesterase